LDEALWHHQNGRRTKAEDLYRRILATDASCADALHLLGVIAHQAGRNDVAVDLIGRATAINGRVAAYQSNYGVALKELGHLDEALAAYDAALRIRPDYAEAHSNRGNVLKEFGRLNEALAAYDAALRIRPDYAEAHSNRGATLAELGRLNDAFAAYDAAVSIRPDYAEAYSNRGVALLDLDRVDAALAAICRSLRLKEGTGAKTLFTACMKRPEFTDCSEDLTEWIRRSLCEPWARPNELTRPAIRLIRKNQTIAALIEALASREGWSENLVDLALKNFESEPLLIDILRVAVLQDVGLERLLTACRASLLRRLLREGDSCVFSESMLNLVCAVAQQCFINEYVFACSRAEAVLVDELRCSVSFSLACGGTVSVWQLVVLASYFPLQRLPDADRLVNMAWPDRVKALLAMHVIEPGRERRIRTQIRRLTDVEDEISVQVQQQYEENPYPRWISAAPVEGYASIDHYLRKAVPQQSYRPQRIAHPDILVVGCGTGQHPIETARKYPAARLLAVDLSLTSLAYAQRKAEEMGLAGIEFVQADLLRLGEVGRRFDVIEAVGVLHHLRDPLAGMRALVSLLRPNGLLRLGLYSDLARQAVVAVRGHIADRGYASTPEDIRRCRQELLAFDVADIRNRVVGNSDFYSMSGCRDLLFHVQEHRFSIPEIAAWLGLFGLTFLGFEIARQVKRLFRGQFPDPVAETDLGRWQRFEEAHPETFGSMYQFWVQKPDRNPTVRT
jgi:tetratricopeptide (TPR) repeat protein/SAM-dependent methyltransferase